MKKYKADATEINDTSELLGELSAEIRLLAKAIPGENKRSKAHPNLKQLSQVERRVLVRSIFAAVEAIVFRLKILALVVATPGSLTPGEIALAKEEDYELDDKGEVKVRIAKLRFLTNFRFAFAVAAKAGGIKFQLDIGGASWQALRGALPVRDRLMHPKRARDLNVTNDEVKCAMEAFEWAFDQAGYLAATGLLQRLRARPKSGWS